MPGKNKLQQPLYVGIDIGKQGAITCLDAFGNIVFQKRTPLIGAEYDIKTLIVILSNPHIKHVCFEVLAPQHFKSSSKAMFGLGFGYGLFQGICTALNVPFTSVRAVDWQKEMFQGVPIQRIKTTQNKKGEKNDTKAMALMAAKRLFPNDDFKGTSDKRASNHDGVVDATLIAEYCRRHFKK